MSNCVESNTDANMQRALWFSELFDLDATEQIGTNSPGWFLRQPERAAQTCHRSYGVLWLLFPPLPRKIAKMIKTEIEYRHCHCHYH